MAATAHPHRASYSELCPIKSDDGLSGKAEEERRHRRLYCEGSGRTVQVESVVDLMQLPDPIVGATV